MSLGRLRMAKRVSKKGVKTVYLPLTAENALQKHFLKEMLSRAF